MPGRSQSEARGDRVAAAERRDQRRRFTASAGGGRRDSVTRVAGREEEPASLPLQSPLQLRPPASAGWLSCDGRRVLLESEPAKSNLARAHTLQGVADRLRQRVYTEGYQLARLQEEVESASGGGALDAARLWYLGQCLQRRLRHHLLLVFREMHLLCEAREHFDADVVVKGAAGPALRLVEVDDLSPSGCTSTTNGRHTPGAQEGGDSDASSAVDAVAALDEQYVSEAEEACSETFFSSGESGRAATTEEVAAAVAADEVAAAMTAEGVAAAVAAGSRGTVCGGLHREVERGFSPVQWSRERFEKRRSKHNSTSSNGSSGSRGSDGRVDSSSGLQETSGRDPEAAAVDPLLFVTVDECEVSAALEVFCELQRHFQQLADILRQHALVADGVLTKARQRGLPEGAALGAEGWRRLHDAVEEHEQQMLLLHDVTLLHSDMQRTHASASQCESALQRIVAALPPAPTMVRLPPTPPKRPPLRGIAWVTSVLKRRLSRRK